jgi:5-(carboxyamino)imidazole ribonucleotide synthase
VRIGVLGGGQLGRMLALAAIPLGHEVTFLEPAAEAAVAGLGRLIAAPFDDPGALADLAARADVVTYEFENVPVHAARALAARVPVHPTPEALAVSQDRLLEKRFLRELGIGTAPFIGVEDRAELARAADQLGLPIVVKTRRSGYDGKGQVIVRRWDDLEAAWQALAPAPCIAEELVAFARELSIVAVRGRDGAVACWPLAENVHRDGILRRSRAPAPRCEVALQHAAERYARAILDRLDYVGVLALELFEVDGALLANEMAPRVHNSGHWTIDGAETSQFENHVRAITGAPLGDCSALGAAAMINLIGAPPPSDTILAVPGAHLHLYGKRPRPGRKVGHVTLRAADAATLEPRLQRLEALVAP